MNAAVESAHQAFIRDWRWRDRAERAGFLLSCGAVLVVTFLALLNRCLHSDLSPSSYRVYSAHDRSPPTHVPSSAVNSIADTWALFDGHRRVVAAATRTL